MRRIESHRAVSVGAWWLLVALGVAVALVLTASAPVYAATEGRWEWQNPRPQGNMLLGVHFIDANTGWAVGYRGTVLKTTNGGSTWIPQTSGSGRPLYAVHFVDANSGWAVGYDAVLKTTNGGSTWTSQTPGAGDTFYDVRFVDANTGWVVGDAGAILKTANAGSTWTTQTSGTDNHLRGVDFTDANTGWVVGDAGTILKTANAGSTWTTQTSGMSSHLRGVDFADANTGWVVGDGGTILKTTNGGSSWTAQTSNSSNTLYSVQFTDANTGWVVGDSGTILRTTNGGATWTAGGWGAGNTLYAVHFADATTGWAVGSLGAIVKTTNGGTTWITQTSGTGNHLRGVDFTDANTGWVVGDSGTILKTANAGSTWTTQTSGMSSHLRGVDFADANTGWVVGDGGTILKTANGGSSWTAQTSGTSVALWAVHFVDANIGWVVGASGTVRKTTDGGSTWTAQTSGTGYTLAAVQFINANTGWAVGPYGTIVKTTNGGSTWTPQTPVTSNTLNGVHFVDANTGWSVDYGGTIRKTTDGGSIWTAQVSGTSSILNAVHFTDANTGWAVGSSGTIVKTTNGGSTWITQQPLGTNPLYAVHFTDANTGWAVGAYGTILKYGSSPLPAPPRSPTPPRRAVYVLPGYLGSKLYDSEGLLWVDEARIKGTVFGWSSSFHLQTGALALDDAGQGDAAWIDAGRDAVGAQDQYEDLVFRLIGAKNRGEIVGYERVHFFPWDWRKDISSATDLLEADITSRGYDQVVLVAHSTGGLLAADFVRQNPGRVEKVVTLAAPLYGTYPSLQALMTGETDALRSDVLADLSAVKADQFRSWVEAVLRNTPCSYQLFPSTGYLDSYPDLVRRSDGSFETIDEAADMYRVLKGSNVDFNDAMIDGASSSHRDFRQRAVGPKIKQVYSSVPSLHMASEGQKTITGVVYKKTMLGYRLQEFTRTSRGDGTVPLFSGLAGVDELLLDTRGVNNYVRYPAAWGFDHGDMKSAPAILDAVVEYIASDALPNSWRPGSPAAAASPASAAASTVMVKIEDEASTTPTAKYVDVVRSSDGSLTARLGADERFGWDGDIFSAVSLDATQTGLQIWIPSVGYQVRLTPVPTAENASVEGTMCITVAVTDDGGAYLASSEFDAPARCVCATLNVDSVGTSGVDSASVTICLPEGGVADCQSLTRDDYSTGVAITESQTVVALGASATFVGHSLPSSGSVSWSSSDDAVIVAEESGTVTAVGHGTAVLTATSADGNRHSSVEVVVPRDADSVSLTCAKSELAVGESWPLSPLFVPSSTTNRSLQYSSDATSVLGVDSEGVVTGVSEGWATVSATTSTGVSASLDLYVFPATVRVSGVSMMPSSAVLRTGDAAAVGALVTPANPTWPQLVWQSSDEGVVSFSATSTNGATITAGVSGEATVSVTTVDGGFVGACAVMVDSVPPVVTSVPQATYLDRADVKISVLDTGTGVAQLHYQLDDEPTVTVSSGEATVTTQRPGMHILKAWAADALGNTSEVLSAGFTVIDATPPGVVCSPAASYIATASISVSASDTGSGVATIGYRLDGGATVTVAGTDAAIVTSVPGAHELAAWATDVADNSSIPLERSFTVIPSDIPGVVTRISGSDRFGVAVELAKKGWNPARKKTWANVDHVIITNGETGKEADPLSAAGLAGAYDAPVLLVTAKAVPASTRAVITEIAARRKAEGKRLSVHIIGGTASVPDAIWNQLKVIPGVSPTKDRIAGADRYSVSAAIATRIVALKGSANVAGVILVAADNPAAFYDALAASPIAFAKTMPMLSVKRTSIPGSVGGVLATTLKGKPRYVASSATYITTPATGASRMTASGNRFVAATDIAKFSTGSARAWTKVTDAGLAAKLPDALTGGAYLGKRGGILLFTESTGVIQPTTRSYIATNGKKIDYGWVLGGTASVPAAQETSFRDLVK